MGLLFSKSDNTTDIQDQLKVLATNVEVLNQKLITDPNATITPGEALIKKQLASTITKLESIEKYIVNNQDKMSQELLENAQALKAYFIGMQRIISVLPHEREVITKEIKRLNEVIDSLSTVNKQWLDEFLLKMEILNSNMRKLNSNIGTLYYTFVNQVDTKVAEISENASRKTFKNVIWFIVGMLVLSGVLSLVFTYVFIKILT